MPYRPMVTPNVVPESRMLEILAKHSPKAGESPKEKLCVQPEPLDGPATQQPAGQPGLVDHDQTPRLQWEKPARGATGVRTTCGRFSCAKVTVNGEVQYELWRMTPQSGCFKLVKAQLSNFQQAQALAEEEIKR